VVPCPGIDMNDNHGSTDEQIIVLDVREMAAGWMEWHRHLWCQERDPGHWKSRRPRILSSRLSYGLAPDIRASATVTAGEVERSQTASRRAGAAQVSFEVVDVIVALLPERFAALARWQLLTRTQLRMHLHH
jgi:hypothetical protein